VALFLSGAEIRAPKEAVTDPQRLLARAAEAFAAPFKAFRKDFPDSAPGWEDNRKLSVTFQRSGILTLTLDQFYFSGGAHPNGGLLHRVLDTRSGDDLVVMSIFKRGVESRLTTLIKREIRKKWKLPAGASLDKQGFWENQIKPENVYVSSSGVGFTYNAYDIAPYVMGPTDIVIPYPALSSLLNPNSPVKELAR
jgi:hypothetical protein